MSTPEQPFKETLVSCPTCGGESVYSTRNPYRPFCREACKLIDLGAWATEAYRVPAPDTDPLSELDDPRTS